MKKINLLYIVTLMLLGMMLVQPVASSSAGSVPIFQPQEVKQTFTPSAVGNVSYYTLTPAKYFNPVMYQSKLPGVFTLVSPLTTSYSPGSTEISPDTSLTYQYSSSMPMTTLNPFINTEYSVPSAVQIDNNQSTLTYKNMAPFSIHLDKSMTFFGESGQHYYAVLKQQGNIILDVNVLTSSANVDIYIYSNTTLIQSKASVQRASIPAFSNSGSYVVIINVNSANSLVTLTPHALTNNMFYSNDLLLNSSYQYTVNQGQCYTTSSSSITGSENLFSQINLFNLPVQQNTYYQIAINNQVLDANSGCSNYGSLNPYLLNTTNSGDLYDPITSMTSAQIISGVLDSNSLTLYSLKTGNLQLALESLGHLNNEVTIYFRSITPPQPLTQVFPLTLNKASYVYNAYNSFTLNAPSVVAVNYTNGASNEGVSFYSYNSTSNLWNSIQKLYPNSNPTNIVNGNLLTTGSFTINNRNWFYLPTGTYAIKNTDHTNYPNLKFTVTAVPVNILTGTTSQTVGITNTSIYAFAPTSNNYQLQLFNLTSSTHDNVSVRYEYAVIGMYNEFFGTSSLTGYIGNKLYTNGWQQYNSNNTNTVNNFRYSDLWAPIIIVHPSYARNSTNGATMTAYSTQLTVKTNIISSNLYSGSIEIVSTPVSTMSTFDVSTAGFSSGNPTYILPLTTDPNSLYNLTVYTQGNTSTYLNLTLSSLQVYGGALDNLDTGFGDLNFSNATTSLMSQIILTQPEATYMSFSFNRYFLNTNGTITVQLTKISSNEMNFNTNYNSINSLTWNKTVSSFEINDTNTLYKLAGPKAAPGFEVVTLVIGLSSIPVLKKMKNKYRKT